MSAAPGDTIPVFAAVHLAGAIDSLDLAYDALGDTLDALQPIDLDNQPAGMDACAVTGIRETFRLFLGIFSGAADAVRVPACFFVVRRCAEQIEDRGEILPGLERAAFALSICVANFEEAIDAIDEAGPGDDWYPKCLAARQTLEMIHDAIEATYRRGPGSFGMN